MSSRRSRVSKASSTSRCDGVLFVDPAGDSTMDSPPEEASIS